MLNIIISHGAIIGQIVNGVWNMGVLALFRFVLATIFHQVKETNERGVNEFLMRITAVFV